MNKLVKSGRVAMIFILLVVMLAVYLVFLYKLQIIQGEEYYNRSNETTTEERRVTASRGNILDRYGRVLVSNKECYNLTIDTAKLFASEDPNSTILELIEMVEAFGDSYTDDLPITTEPPFEYDPNMTDIQRTMLEAYFKDATRVKEFKAAGISEPAMTLTTATPLRRCAKLRDCAIPSTSAIPSTLRTMYSSRMPAWS